MDSDTPAPARDPDLYAPLARFDGAKPPAPRWFENILAAPVERHMLAVEGGDIEWLAWGARGRPGLLLLHGNSAHADWWRFTAPYLADRFRIVAPSLPGMGNSAHRPSYRMSATMDGLMQAADAGGLGARFAVAGHSFGGMIAMGLAGRFPARVGMAIAIDAPFGDAGNYDYTPSDILAERPVNYYPTLAEAFRHFRFMPPQPSPNPFITDFIARTSLSETERGFRWKFDSNYMAHSAYDVKLVVPAASDGQKLGYIAGADSIVIKGHEATIRGMLPEGAPFLVIPDAGHHIMVDQPIALVVALRALLA